MTQSTPATTPTQSPAPISTPARVHLGRTGVSIPLSEHLRFQLDHALARDAVHASLDVPSLLGALRARNLSPIAVESLVPQQNPGTQEDVSKRQTYLRRPDLGRRLHPDSLAALQQLAAEPSDVAIILADGLSALAVECHALPLLDALLDALLPALTAAHSLAPVVVASQARVAIGDEIASALHARIALVLIGERPGLSAPDSLGIYLTWNPRPGLTTDAQRNCISNIRLDGLSYTEAAQRILAQVAEAKQLGRTGVSLGGPALPQSLTEALLPSPRPASDFSPRTAADASTDTPVIPGSRRPAS